MTEGCTIFSPPPRIRYSCTQVNNQIYIFGGTAGAHHGSFWNDVFILDTTHWKWLEPNCVSGNVPLARYGHSATHLRLGDGNGFLVVFGGKSVEGLLNDVQILNLDNLSWRMLSISGKVPDRRYYHSATHIGDGKIVIFGGRTREGESNDLVILDMKGEQWIWPEISGKGPSKRYQHSAFYMTQQNQIAIYGGINRMTSLQDLFLLDLEKMQWERPKIKNEEEYYKRAHTYSWLVGDKMLIFDFEALKQHRLHYLTIESKEQATWEWIEIEGDPLDKETQYYCLTSLNSTPIFMHLKNTDCSLSILEADETMFENRCLQMKRVHTQRVDTQESHSICPMNMVEIECHYANTQLFSTFISSDITLESLKCIIEDHYQIDNCHIMVREKNKYHSLSKELHKEFFSAQHTKSKIILYVAQAPRAQDKSEALEFLTTEAENLPSSPWMRPIQGKIKRGNIQDDGQEESSSDVQLPLPMLFGQPIKRSLMRSIHKKMNHFQNCGLKRVNITQVPFRQMRSEEQPLLRKENTKARRPGFNWRQFFFALCRWLLLPIFTPYYLLSNRFGMSGKFYIVTMTILCLACIALPTAGILYPLLEYETPYGLLITPAILYIILSAVISTVEATRKDPKKEAKELTKYSVTMFQRLVTGEYGERKGSLEDIIYAITTKEATTKDKPLYFFITYIFSFLGSGIHSCIIFIYLYSVHKLHHSNWKVNTIVILGVLLNFAIALMYLLSLGCAIAIYVRQRTHIDYFGIITSKQHAKELDLPTLPLNSIENIMAWMKLRNYIRGHHFLPLITADAILTWLLIVVGLLWIVISMQIFASDVVFTIASVQMYCDTVVLTVFLIFTIRIGAKINTWKMKHTNMLLKQELVLSLQIQKLKQESRRSENKKLNEEEIEELQGCMEVLPVIVEIIEKEDTVFHLLGFSLSNDALNAILGLIVAVLVSLAAKMGTMVLV